MDEKYFARIYNGSSIRGHTAERTPRHHPYEINWNARTIHSLRETLN
jgi:hypothetical protein